VNPWTIIGWTLIALAALFLLYRLGRGALLLLGMYLMRRRALQTPPRAGQTWIQNGTLLTIEQADAAIVRVALPNGGWTESRSSWDQRVVARGLMLLEDADG
jgi:hypothetical protein